jgi:hypothetical protein
LCIPIDLSVLRCNKYQGGIALICRVFEGAIGIKKVYVDISRISRCNRYRRYYVDMLRICQGAIGIEEVHVDNCAFVKEKGFWKLLFHEAAHYVCFNLAIS